MGILDGVLGIGSLLSDIGGAVLGSHSAARANETNIKIARENREWEKELSNTAVQRRADDIEAAGGNRALAFTNGQSASTPTASTPTVEPTFRPEWTKGGGISTLMAMETIRSMRTNNLKAAQEARLTDQEARIKKIEADAAERYGIDKADWEYQKASISVDEAKARLNKLLAETANTAAETDRLRKTTDSLVQMAEQQARSGKLDLDALENVAKMGGVEASKMSSVIKTVLDVVRTFKRNPK